MRYCTLYRRVAASFKKNDYVQLSSETPISGKTIGGRSIGGPETKISAGLKGIIVRYEGTNAVVYFPDLNDFPVIPAQNLTLITSA